MPTYQYACTACGEQLEVVQRFTDDALTVCPACQGRLRKVFSAVGVVFKGSGFYRTDSRAAANGSASDGKGSSGDGKGSASESSSDGTKSSEGSSAKKEPAGAASASSPKTSDSSVA